LQRQGYPDCQVNPDDRTVKRADEYALVCAAIFKARVIPWLDVKDGPVVKDMKSLDLRGAGDPVEAAIAYDAAGETPATARTR
jgi:hypothetical protein